MNGPQAQLGIQPELASSWNDNGEYVNEVMHRRADGLCMEKITGHVAQMISCCSLAIQSDAFPILPPAPLTNVPAAI